MKYRLVNQKTRMVMEGVTIDESVKEEFKKMMGWDEMDWRRNTEVIKEKNE